jgi:hypothetical protein
MQFWLFADSLLLQDILLLKLTREERVGSLLGHKTQVQDLRIYTTLSMTETDRWSPLNPAPASGVPTSSGNLGSS